MAMSSPRHSARVPTLINELSDDESEFSGFDKEVSQVYEKDEEEAELERAIFGTQADFRQDISRFYEDSNKRGTSELVKAKDAAQDAEEDLDIVDDADVRNALL
jgi:hypothetical protein